MTLPKYSNRNRVIGAVIGITALMLTGLAIWSQLSLMIPDAEGFLPPTPTSPPTAGEIIISSPVAGDTLYAELIRVTGDIRHMPQRLVARLVDIDDTILAQAPIITQLGAFTIEMPRPQVIGEVMIQIVSAVDPSVVRASIPVFFADSAMRPSGIFGSIITPSDGEQVGGDTILVRGRVSGIRNNTIQLVLQDADNTTIIHDVTIHNPYGVDDVIWQTDLPLDGLSGSVVLTAYFTPSTDPNPIFSRVTLVITQVAG
jgi:hypothetical protein